MLDTKTIVDAFVLEKNRSALANLNGVLEAKHYIDSSDNMHVQGDFNHNADHQAHMDIQMAQKSQDLEKGFKVWKDAVDKAEEAMKHFEHCIHSSRDLLNRYEKREDLVIMDKAGRNSTQMRQVIDQYDQDLKDYKAELGQLSASGKANYQKQAQNSAEISQEDYIQTKADEIMQSWNITEKSIGFER